MIERIIDAVVWLSTFFRRCGKWFHLRSVDSKRWDRHTNRFLMVMDDSITFIEHERTENFTDIWGTFEFALILRGHIDDDKHNARLALALYQESENPMWIDTYHKYRNSARTWRKEMRDNEDFVPKRNFMNWYDKMKKERGGNAPWPHRPRCSEY